MLNLTSGAGLFAGTGSWVKHMKYPLSIVGYIALSCSFGMQQFMKKAWIITHEKKMTEKGCFYCVSFFPRDDAAGTTGAHMDGKLKQNKLEDLCPHYKDKKVNGLEDGRKHARDDI